MSRNFSIGMALVAALVAVAIVIAGGPLWAAIVVAVGGGLAATYSTRLSAPRRDSGVGIR